MTIDPKILAELRRAGGFSAEQLDQLVGVMLTCTSETFTEHTGADHVAFMDCTLRLLAGTLFKLDADAAREYLAALADRHETGMALAVSLAEIRRRACLNRLAQAFALAAGDTRGSC